MNRSIIKGFFIVLVLSAVLFMGHKTSYAQTIDLKMAHFMPPNHIQHLKSFVPFAEKVEELSQGRVKIKIYPAKALGGPKQLPDAVKMGITDIAFIIPSYTSGRFPRSSVFDLPYLFDNASQATRGIYEVYDYIAEDYKDYEVLWLYTAPPSQLLSVTSPVTSQTDIKGMKIRTGSTMMTRAIS